MTIDNIIGSLKHVKGSNKQYTALCPAHDDQSNSLSISESSDGKTLIHCHAGYSVESIVQALGLKMTDLFPENKEDKPKKTQRPKYASAEAEYLYYDLNGNVLHKTIRYGKQYEKPFAQARPDPNQPGKWLYNLKDIKTVLYQLPQVVAAIAEKKPIFIVEGEKDADNIQKLGFTATTCPMGAGKWKSYYSDYLVNAICYIIPDNDKPGKDHARHISRSLMDKAALIKILDLTTVYPKLKEKGDISDFFQELGKDEGLKLLEQLIESASEIKPDLSLDEKKALMKNYRSCTKEQCITFKAAACGAMVMMTTNF